MFPMLTLTAIAIAMILGGVLLSFRMFQGGGATNDDEHQLVTLGAARPRSSEAELQ